jgi:hypothetical protein
MDRSAETRVRGNSSSRSVTSGAAGGGVPAILSCRLRVNLPSSLWMQPFTVLHPDVRLEVFDRMELEGDLTMFEVHILSHEARGWSEEIRILPGVTDVELIDATDNVEVCRVVFRGKTFVPLLKKLRLFSHLPFPVLDGVARWTVVGPQRKVCEFLKSLETESAGIRVDSITHGPLLRNPSLLTPRQQDVLRRAFTEGYFDVPRRISLTALAAKLGVAISTLSVTLAVIEKKILEPHL